MSVLEDAAFLGDPDPAHAPRLPSPLAGSAVLCLAALDQIEAKEGPRSPWRGRSAYNVLRRVVGEARWGDELRQVMDAVLDGSLDTESLTSAVARVIEVADVVANPSMGSVAQQGVPSPPAPLADAATGGERGAVAAPDTGGDGTETSEPASKAASAEDSSHARSPKRAGVRGAVAPNSTGGDGSETSGGASEDCPPGASSPPVHDAVGDDSADSASGKESPRPTGRAAVTLFAFKESLQTPSGAPRESGRVEGQLVRDDQPPARIQVSRQQYEALAALAKDRVVPFPGDESGQRARNRLRRRLEEWGVAVSVPARRRGAGQAHALRLEGRFAVLVADGSADRAASLRRLAREAERQHYLGQD
jgi:hypothetical protein